MSTCCLSRRLPSASATGAPTTERSPPAIAMPWSAWPTSTARSARRSAQGLHRRDDVLGARSARADQRRSAEQSDDLVGDFLRWRAHVNGQGLLVRGRLLEGIDLALQEGGRHEMPMTSGQVFRHNIASAASIDQTHFRPIADDGLAIGALQRGASDDARLLLGALTVDPGGNGLKPWLAIRIGQRDAGVHFRDVGLGMERVALLERPAKASRQFLRDRRLAGT